MGLDLNSYSAYVSSKSIVYFLCFKYNFTYPSSYVSISG